MTGPWWVWVLFAAGFVTCLVVLWRRGRAAR